MKKILAIFILAMLSTLIGHGNVTIIGNDTIHREITLHYII